MLWPSLFSLQPRRGSFISRGRENNWTGLDGGHGMARRAKTNMGWVVLPSVHQTMSWHCKISPLCRLKATTCRFFGLQVFDCLARVHQQTGNLTSQFSYFFGTICLLERELWCGLSFCRFGDASVRRKCFLFGREKRRCCYSCKVVDVRRVRSLS